MRKPGELTESEAKKIIKLAEDFDIFDCDYLYMWEDVKEEYKTSKSKSELIQYFEEIKRAEDTEEGEELRNRIEEIQKILNDRIIEQTTASINKQAKKLGAILLPR